MSENLRLITGSTLQYCQNWQTEGALRCLINNLCQGRGKGRRETEDDLIVYGGNGKAARNWDCFDAIVRTLSTLRDDHTLLIQSGKPVGVFKTTRDVPRVLIANSNLVGYWSTDETFNKLEAAGLTMYGQMTAGSWIYIGGQGIVQGTYETFRAAKAAPGMLLVSAGLGNMGNAQGAAITMCGAAGLFAEVDPARIARCKEEGWISRSYTNIEAAVEAALIAKKHKEPIAIAFQGTAIKLLQFLVDNGITPDILTDQTPAHDPRFYCPEDMPFEMLERSRKSLDAQDVQIEMAKSSMAKHVELMLQLMDRGAETFDYGNGIRKHAADQGVERAYEIEGFVLKYVRELFCEGRGPFRMVALSGNPADIAILDNSILRKFPHNELLCSWIRHVQTIDFSKQPGLPARVCWLGMGERALMVDEIWKAGKAGLLEAPIVIGRDHLDCGSVASPLRETEGMRDGSDAIADWPLLNALLNTACGASWVSIHNGGGVGIGLSQHAGQCFVVTPDNACRTRAQKLFRADPGIGVLRHADAGYETAIAVASRHGLRIPMREG